MATDLKDFTPEKQGILPPAKSMNELFQRLPEHVRVSQRRGVTTGIVGYHAKSPILPVLTS